MRALRDAARTDEARSGRGRVFALLIVAMAALAIFFVEVLQPTRERAAVSRITATARAFRAAYARETEYRVGMQFPLYAYRCPRLNCRRVGQLAGNSTIQVLWEEQGDEWNGSSRWLAFAADHGVVHYLHASLATLNEPRLVRATAQAQEQRTARAHSLITATAEAHQTATAEVHLRTVTARAGKTATAQTQLLATARARQTNAPQARMLATSRAQRTARSQITDMAHARGTATARAQQYAPTHARQTAMAESRIQTQTARARQANAPQPQQLATARARQTDAPQARMLATSRAQRTATARAGEGGGG